MKGNFQLILVIIFIVAAVLGIMVFSGAIPLGNKKDVSPLKGNVTLWGTQTKTAMAPLIEKFNGPNQTFKLSYSERSAETFNQDLLEALAEGQGPDLFLLPDDLVFSYSNKIYTVPYANFSSADFKSTYAGAAEVFLGNKGTIAFPLTIDPLVMYYNRSILDTNGIVYPPAYWDEFNEMSGKITKKDDAGQIIKSAVGFGQYSNVNNAKDIVTALFMQTGNPIVQNEGGALRSSLSGLETSKSLGDALAFYTSFADPLKPSYSWNKSFPNSQDAFSSGSVAFYFGFASELPTLIKKNPNQNLGIAPLPQIKNSSTKATRGRVAGIAVSSFSKNFTTAYATASLLASGDFAKDYSEMMGLAPARRSLLAQKQTGVNPPLFYTEALVAKSWMDPSPKDTNDIFRLMIESTLSNSVKPRDAVLRAGDRLNSLLLR